MRHLYVFISLIVLASVSHAQSTKSAELSSPDNTTSWQVAVNDKGKLVYKVSYKKKAVTTWSDLNLLLNNEELSAVVISRIERKKYNEKFSWPLGENDVIVNHCNEIKLYCRSANFPFTVIARAYNGSIAFRYEVSMGDSSEIREERTSFNFTTPYTIYQYNQESVFTPGSIDTFTKTCDFPATLTNHQFFISIGEADNFDYTKGELRKGAEPHSLEISFRHDPAVRFKGNLLTPWRTISIAEKATGLHRFSDLNLKLASSPSTTVPNWIKPGKLIRAQLTTQAGLDCIDFAAAHQFRYIMYDAGWYGAEFNRSADPTQVIPEIDMQRVINYGKEKGIGVILYVNYVGLRAKLDTILPLYKQWGVAGLKFGFVDGLSNSGIRWLTNATRKVYEHEFILNIHDNYKPTGLSRTFPQLLTQEGIRGDENSPDAFHTTTLPFTRFLAGPADFTFCYPNATNSYSKNLKVTMAHQLALTVVYFSPLQAMFWYGKPKEYTNEEEIEFFKYVPTVWNESHYLSGDIGQNISVARRSGDAWFVGNVAGLEDWQSSIAFNFLKKGKTYQATIYEDDGNGSIRKKIMAVKKNDRFSFHIRARGGQGIIIR